MNARKPKYQFVLDSIIEMIKVDSYKEGEKIPSIQQLASKYKVSISAVWHAVNILKAQGVLKVIPKSGIYIKGNAESGNYDEADSLRINEAVPTFFIAADLEPGVKVLRFNLMDRHPRMVQYYKEVVDAYSKKNQYARIQLITSGQLPSMSLSTADSADILQLPSHYIAAFIEKGKLLELENSGARVLDRNSFFDSAIEAASFNGKLWGVPFLVAVHCIYSNEKNKDILNGASESRTFWELIAYLNGLAKQTSKNNWESLVATTMDPLAFPLHAGMAWPEYYEDLLEFKDDFKVFFSRFANFYLNPAFFWRSKNICDMRRDKLLALFFENKTPFYFTNSSLPLILEPGSKIGAAAWPTSGDLRIPSSMNMICASSASRFPEECMKFLSYLSSSQVQCAYAKLGATMARKDVRKACYAAHVKTDWDILMDSVDRMKTYNSRLIDIDTIREMIIFQEFYKWQIEKTDLEHLFKAIQNSYNDYIRRPVQ